MPMGVYPRKKGVRPWLVKANLGSKHTEEHKRKIGLKSKGNQYAKGYVATKELREKRKILSKGNKYALGKNIGRKHWNWKGDNASYDTIHDWVNYYLGKADKCVRCGLDKIPEGKKRYFEWASISQEAKRDVNDYMQLCIPCHRQYDKNPIALGVYKYNRRTK